MDALRRLVQTEPAVLVGVILSCLLLAGVRLGETHAEALTQVVTFVLPLIGSAIVRQSVTPVARTVHGPETTAEHGENPELIDDGDPR